MTERFVNLANSVARARGKRDFPIVVWPSNVEEMTDEEVRALAERTFDSMVEKLTRREP
ncbi:MAG: hypothetical protein HYY00_00540 [Chloroflexi bacterium]|nr:hypothetical protein [Chloroflexota bacterium]